MNLKKKLSSSLVATVALTTLLATNPAFAEESIEDLQKEQESINNTISEKKAQLENNNTLKNETVSKLKNINDSINSTEAKISSFTAQIADQQASIDETNKQIAETEAKLSKAQSSLNERLVTIYKDGSVDYLEVLFQSKDFSDFLTRFQYLTYITKHDKELLDEVKETKAILEGQKATLEQQLNALNALKSEEESVKALLQTQQAQQQEIYKELENDEEALKENIAEMQNASENIGAQIVQLQQEAAAREAARKAAEAANAASTGSGSSTAVTASSATYTTQAAGSGVWPAPDSKVITSSYGGRSYPLNGSYNYHLGIDIGASYGTPVVAYQGGTVLIASYHWSYGNYVVVDHGNGLSTLYAHMSALSVSAGETVSAGQQVGAIGSTGSSTGPHLHFEVRINGVTTDPAAYLGL